MANYVEDAVQWVRGRRMVDEGSGLRHIARVMRCSPATAKKSLDVVAGKQGDDP